MKTARTEMVLSFSEAPTSLERIAEDRRARMQRATAQSLAEQIPCPGGCGNMATLETPITITRDGVTRTVRMAQCQGNCRQETKNPRTGRPRSTPARFDIPWESPTATPEPSELGAESLAQALARTLSTSGITQCEAGAQIGCSQSSVSKLLRGLPVSASTMSAAQQWVNSRKDGAVQDPPQAQSQPNAPSTDPASQDGEALVPAPSTDPAPQAGDALLPALSPDPAPQAGDALVPAPSPDPAPQAGDALAPAPLTDPAPRAGRALALVPAPSTDPVISPDPELSLEEAPQADAVSPVSPGPERPSEPTATPAAAMVASDSKPGCCASVPEAPLESPYQAVLRRLLERAAQTHLEQVAGAAAKGIRVRVSLEWADGEGLSQ